MKEPEQTALQALRRVSSNETLGQHYSDGCLCDDVRVIEAALAARQPLTNEQIEAIGKALLDHGFHPWEGLQPWVYTFARRIEQAHGIGGARNG